MRSYLVAVIGITAALAAATLASPGSQATTPHLNNGVWHLVDGSSHVLAGTPAVSENGKHVATILWLDEPTTSKFTYETAQVAAHGGVSKSLHDVFAGNHFDSLSAEPTLVGAGNSPLVIFNGGRGSNGPYSKSCIYGAKGGGAGAWTLQTWSLSNDCTNPKGTAAEGKNGVLGAAWGLAGWVGGHGVLYRVGTSSTIPATGADSEIPVDTNGADAAAVGMAADTAASGDFYVAWTRVFTNNHSDGFYVEDVTTHSAAKKAPGSGTNSTNRLPANLAMSQRITRPGVYIAYCSNATTCKVELWRVGAAKAMTVPASSNAYSESVSAGPGGRMWVGWYNDQTNRVSLVRTNKNVTRFGPVQTYATPCAEHGLLGLSSGTSGRLDVALQCIANSPLRAQVYAYQRLVPLSVSVSPQSVKNTAAHNVTVTVRDVGDPVAHATVHYGAQRPTTNSSGRATIHVAKGTSTGAKQVNVTATDYKSGSATLHVTH